jgi:hypothetical protein
MPAEIIEGEQKGHNIFLSLLLLGCAVAIASTFYFYYFKKNYDFVVEVSCDPAIEICTQRDCSNPDDCPPNGLPDFKRYHLNAADFEMCENEDCKIACETGMIECEQEECAEAPEYGESCSVLETPE